MGREKEAHLKEGVEALQIALTEVTGLICIHIFGEGFKIKNDHLQPWDNKYRVLDSNTKDLVETLEMLLLLTLGPLKTLEMLLLLALGPLKTLEMLCYQHWVH